MFFRWASQGKCGFTIIEILVIIGVVGALAVFAATGMWSSVSNFKFSAAVNKVIGDVRYTQHLARTHNGWYGIEFFANPQNTYHVYSTTGAADVDVADPANRALTLSVDLNASYGGIEIQAVDIGGGNKVEFNPIGTPYLDKNGAQLAATGTITLSLGESTRTIQILKNTGKVELQ